MFILNQWPKEAFEVSLALLVNEELRNLPNVPHCAALMEALNEKYMHALLELSNPAGSC